MIQWGRKQYVGAAFILLGSGFLFYNWYSREPPPAKVDFEALIEDLAFDESLLDETKENPLVHAHKPVSDAYYRLKSARKAAFPTLIKHMDDDRFSHNRCYADTVEITVGKACRFIIDEQVDPRGLSYKSRETPGGSGMRHGVNFEDYVRIEFGEYQKWWDASKQMTLLEMRITFCKWRIAKERQFGFVSEEQKEQMEESFERMYAEASSQPEDMPWPPPKNFAVDCALEF